MPTVDTGQFEIFYVEEGEGFPVVLIHGLAGDHRAWLPQIAVLKDRHRVIAFDNPGSGGSSDVTDLSTTEDLARATLSMMDSIDIDRAHVIGRSMGGAIAQHTALLAPDRVHTLTLASSFAKFDPVGTRVLSNMREILEWRDNWTDWARHSTWAFFSPKSYNEQPEAVANMQAIIGDETRSKISYVNLNKACLEHDTLDRLSEITCPTLIMAGAADPVCSLTATRWMQEGIPHAETVIFENSSHFFLIEEADKAMFTIEDWLQRHTP
jgi:3-oxoadipate enol-lactonase